MEIIAPVVEEVSAQVWNDTNWSSPLLTYLKNITEKKVQGQIPDSELIHQGHETCLSLPFL